MAGMGGKRTLSASIGRRCHPEPLLCGSKHFLDAQMIADRVEVRIDFQMADVHRALHLIEEGLESFDGLFDEPITRINTQARL